MAKEHDIGSRHSRWVWQTDDVVIIKKGDEHSEKALDQVKSEIPVPGDRTKEELRTQDDQTQGQ